MKKVNFLLIIIISLTIMVGSLMLWFDHNIDASDWLCDLWVIEKTEWCKDKKTTEACEYLCSSTSKGCIDICKGNLVEDLNIQKEDKIDEEININADEVEEINFTEEQLQLYYPVYNDPYVIHLRKALNGYLDGTNRGMEIPEAVIEDQGISVQSGLSSFDKSYYESKFVVLFIDNNAPMGGSVISIIFQDKPDKIFDAWVYDMLEDEYDLRGFWARDMSNNEIDVIMKQYGELIRDKEHSL